MWNGKGICWMKYVEIEVLLASSIPQTETLLADTPPPVESIMASNPSLVLSPIPGPSNGQSQDAASKPAMQIFNDGLVHASYCNDTICQLTLCQNMKNLLSHFHSCSQSQGHKECQTCNRLFDVFQNHAKQCKTEENCPVPLCVSLKQKMPPMQQLAPVQTPLIVVNPPQQQSQPKSMNAAVKKILQTLQSHLAPEGKQRIFKIVSISSQLVTAFKSYRTTLQEELNEQQEDLADFQQQQIRRQIQQLDQIFTVLRQTPNIGPTANNNGVLSQAIGAQSVMVQSAPQSKWSQLSDLCSLPSLDGAKMLQFLELVSDKTVNINFPNSAGFPPLAVLLRHNQSQSLIPCLKSLLKREEINLEVMNLFGHNALTIICRYNTSKYLIECTKLLIQRGVNMLNADSCQRNALLLVCEFYRGEKMMELLQLLLQNGTNVLQENNHAENALFLLCRHYKRVNLISLIRLLIWQGVKLNCINNRKQTALHPLCRYYSSPDLLAILKLLAQGIKVTAEDCNKETVLTLICRYYRQPNLLEIIRFLVIGCGLSVDKVQEDLSRSAFAIVCQYQILGNDLMDIIRFFIQQGIDLTASDAQGRNILHILCGSGKNCGGKKLARILRLLKEEAQVDVTALNPLGQTPLDVFLLQKPVQTFNGEIIHLLCH